MQVARITDRGAARTNILRGVKHKSNRTYVGAGQLAHGVLALSLSLSLAPVGRRRGCWPSWRPSLLRLLIVFVSPSLSLSPATVTRECSRRCSGVRAVVGGAEGTEQSWRYGTGGANPRVCTCWAAALRWLSRRFRSGAAAPSSPFAFLALRSAR